MIAVIYIAALGGGKRQKGRRGEKKRVFSLFLLESKWVNDATE